MWRERYNKYGAKKARGSDGYVYASKKEAGFAAELETRKKAGDIKDWERQVRISLVGTRDHICDYIVDFLVHHKDGTKEYVEIKGMILQPWPIKWKLLQDNLGDDPLVKFTVIR